MGRKTRIRAGGCGRADRSIFGEAWDRDQGVEEPSPGCEIEQFDTDFDTDPDRDETGSCPDGYLGLV